MMLTVGQKFGGWVVVEEPKKGRALCLCTVCNDCTRNVKVSDLTSGKSMMCRSCSASKTKEQKVPIEYNSWTAMKDRCLNPNSKDYEHYGGRGIKIYPLWVDSFDAFLMMVGKRPSPDYTIDRIDVNGNYEPGNVRWVSRAEQTRNQRSNVKVEYDGEIKTIAEWSRDDRCPVSAFTIYKRLDRGWEPIRAIFEPSANDVEDFT